MALDLDLEVIAIEYALDQIDLALLDAVHAQAEIVNGRFIHSDYVAATVLTGHKGADAHCAFVLRDYFGRNGNPTKLRSSDMQRQAEAMEG
jgi:hypothetical protein